MKNTKKILATSVVTVVAVGTFSANVTNASFDKKDERREAIHAAFKNHDLKAFHDVLQKSKWAQQIDTDEEFDAVILAYNLRKEKKYKEAREVLEAAGIERPVNIKNRGPRADVRDAIVRGDWNTFKELVAKKRLGKRIDTKEKFEKLREVRELRREGRKDEARALMKELRAEYRK